LSDLRLSLSTSEIEKLKKLLLFHQKIIDHEKTDSLKGFVSLIGGKLASYRIMSEELTDFLCQRMGVVKKCTTHLKPLPGGDEVPDISQLANQYGLEPYLVSRLIFRHGSQARVICDMMQADPSLRAIICGCEPVTKAEIVHVLKNEMVASLDDLKRRTRLSLGPCQGMNCLLAAVSSLSDAGLVTHALEELKMYREKNWPNRAVVLDEGQLVQDYLLRAVMYTANAL